MILANLTPKPMGLRITPKTTCINEEVCLETITLLQANEDLVHQRLQLKIVEIIEHAAKHNHIHHNISTSFLKLETH